MSSSDTDENGAGRVERWLQEKQAAAVDDNKGTSSNYYYAHLDSIMRHEAGEEAPDDDGTGNITVFVPRTIGGRSELHAVTRRIPLPMHLRAIHVVARGCKAALTTTCEGGLWLGGCLASGAERLGRGCLRQRLSRARLRRVASWALVIAAACVCVAAVSRYCNVDVATRTKTRRNPWDDPFDPRWDADDDEPAAPAKEAPAVRHGARVCAFAAHASLCSLAALVLVPAGVAAIRGDGDAPVATWEAAEGSTANARHRAVRRRRHVRCMVAAAAALLAGVAVAVAAKARRRMSVVPRSAHAVGGALALALVAGQAALGWRLRGAFERGLRRARKMGKGFRAPTESAWRAAHAAHAALGRMAPYALLAVAYLGVFRGHRGDDAYVAYLQSAAGTLVQKATGGGSESSQGAMALTPPAHDLVLLLFVVCFGVGAGGLLAADGATAARRARARMSEGFVTGVVVVFATVLLLRDARRA